LAGGVKEADADRNSGNRRDDLDGIDIELRLFVCHFDSEGPAIQLFVGHFD